MNSIFKAYVTRNLFRDLRRFVRRSMRRVEFDRDYWLHRAGLARYRPVKRAFGGFALMLLGGIGGAVAALSLAPKPGAELRADVKERAKRLMEKAAEHPAPGVQPEAGARA